MIKRLENQQKTLHVRMSTVSARLLASALALERNIMTNRQSIKIFPSDHQVLPEQIEMFYPLFNKVILGLNKGF